MNDVIIFLSRTDLVPVYSFGENDLFLQVGNPEGSWLRAFQRKFKNIAGFSPPVFSGRGIFNYTFGMLPYRKPVRTIGMFNYVAFYHQCQ